MRNAALTQVSIEKRTPSNTRIKPIRNQSSLIDLTTNFALLQRPTNKDISLYKEQFYTLILNTNSKERKIISDKIAYNSYTPKPIIIFLSMEEIAIAQLPLLHSPVLQPADLNLLIEKSSLEYAMIIAKRDNLDSSNVVSLLKLDNEAEQIQNTLRSNPALTGNIEILEALDKERNSTKWADEPATTITVAKLAEVKNPTITNKPKDLSETLLKLANKGGKLRKKPIGKSIKTASSMITLQEMENRLLINIRSQNISDFASSIQSFCGLNHQITTRFMEEQNAGMLATLLKALEISEVTAARILLMANRDIGRNALIFKTITAKYTKLNQDECCAFFRRLGANFNHSHFKEDQNIPTTRYALSLAARARRSELLIEQKASVEYSKDEKLTA